uniref:Uncharacterized protein n=1 Tax=Oryza meridionalis TaxID=40149 RepID=A0A0E0F691_9ORYZ
MHRVQARQPSVESAHRGILIYYCYSIQVAVRLSPPPYQVMLSSCGAGFGVGSLFQLLPLVEFGAQPRGKEGEQIVSSKLSSKNNRCSGVEFEFDSSVPNPGLQCWNKTEHGEAVFEVAAGSYDVAHVSCYKCNRCNC